MSETRPVVLFLCTTNTVRSQMAEALLRHHAGDRLAAVSAGLVPGSAVHPLALRVLEEKGIDTTGLRPKHVRDLVGSIRVTKVVSVSYQASQACPILWPGPVDMQHWPIDYPLAVDSSEDGRLAAFRTIFDAIAARIADWLRASCPGQADGLRRPATPEWICL